MVKKEKVVKQYTRKSKSGKTVVVKQHTAKYDAAEDIAKQALKSKEGSGKELEDLKKKKPEKVKEILSDEELREIDYPQKDIDAVAKALGLTQREAASWMAGTDFSGYRKADMKKGDKAAKKYLGDDVFSKLDPTDADAPLAVLAKLGRKMGGSKFMRVRDLVNASKAPKVEKAPKGDTSYGFTADEYKAWYHWDQDADPKNKTALKVEKALKKQMGTKAYNKYFDEITDSYSSRGHNKAFKGLSEKLSMDTEKASIKPQRSKPNFKEEYKTEKEYMTAKEGLAKGYVPKSMIPAVKSAIKKYEKQLDEKSVTPKSSDSSLKVGSSIQMGNSTSLGKGKKETFKVLAVQKTNKQDRELGNTEAAWVQRKDGSVTLALKDSEKGWMYDDTWTSFTNRKHPYAKSLESAGYSFKKAQGKGGKYWEVSKESATPSKEGMPKKSKSTAGVTDGASAVKYNGKTYMVTRNGSVETITGRKVGKALSDKILSEKFSKKEDPVITYAKEHGYTIKRDGTFGYKGDGNRVKWTATREQLEKNMKKRKHPVADAIKRDFGVKEKGLTIGEKQRYAKEHGFTRGGMRDGRRIYKKNGKEYVWNSFDTKLVKL